MSKKGVVPDAWDDDWENTADNATTEVSQPEPVPKLSKAQRRAQHAEQQRRLWDTAENPGRNLWLEAQGVVPLKQEFKPQVTLLSRKPPTIAKRDAADAMSKLGLDEDEDSEDEARKRREADFEERQRKAKLEREEKQKRYAEARERIMGSLNPSPAPASRESSHGRENRRNRGARAPGNNRNSQSGSPIDLSPARHNLANSDRQLFDPDDMGRRPQPRQDSSSTPKEDQPLRQPRGPDTSGRGGFGFSNRGDLART